jgi:hypothetical protein
MLGQVYMLTSMAVTKSGSRSMAQMEVAVTPPWKFQLGGALTLAGPLPYFETPNSANLQMIGNDAAGTGVEPAGCNNTPGTQLPAIGVADSQAQSCVVTGNYTDPLGNQQSCPLPVSSDPAPKGLGKPPNYIGLGGTGSNAVDVTNAANPDPTELTQMVTDLYGAANQKIGPNPQPVPCSDATSTSPCGNFTNTDITNYGSVTNLQTIVVNGNLTLSGNPSGSGVLVVAGNLTMQGNFSWNGVILVLGTATVTHNGGGNGQITGAMYVANNNGSALGQSSFNWSGGGTNTIQYDHCWADDLLNKFPPSTTDQPLQVLSSRVLTF